MPPLAPLAKVIAKRGDYSRKAASQLIRSGQVSVNGQTALPQQHVNCHDIILINQQSLPEEAPRQYWIYHKPVGIDCNNKPNDAASIAKVLAQFPVRLFAVGRLDKDSRGLLLLTNDGDWAQRLLHPRFEHIKRYQISLSRDIIDAAAFIAAFAAGLHWQVGPHHYQAKPCKVQVLSARQCIITLSEGQHRQIRYMCRALGYQVIDLLRIAVGELSLGELAPGEYRALTPAEVELASQCSFTAQPNQTTDAQTP